ncbi:DUF4230 domain-containing protein [Erythrobacter sp. 3-20A1M]|uniref:DUF4230 domain-containing protein n=1 Tax=Erythrobacter sp. 3-20A1M TaxID=2653850 RepID=UPI001BFCABA7|nr:DUF4230 domain-containing protein [Erythrobacter sp. 3-20A1M]QWC56460.1 DUF4230 domain-containing protein [Erythrobacter sp. 3-20A1M]
MANDVKNDLTSRTEPTIHKDRPLARVQALPWLIVIVLVAAVAWLGWRAFLYKEEGDPVGSAMLAFQKQNSLNVFSSRFEVVAESTNAQGVLGIDILKSRQAAIIPAMVEYRLDLSQMDRDRFAWNDASDTLDVTLPPLRISRPNLDEAAAKTYTQGSFVTGGAAQAMAKNNSQQAERKAAEFAKNPEVLRLARQAAKEAVRQNLAIPLQVAGYGDVKVNVHFDGEKTPSD